MPREELLASLAGMHELDKGVSDVLHRDAGVAVNRFFERKYDQHPIHDRAHRLHASGSPGPQLRTDVVDDGNAEPFDAACQREVEIGKIDDHQNVGTMDASPTD